MNDLARDLFLFLIGLRKKLEALAKQKDCQLIGKWVKSITNHLYWCVASTHSGDGDVIKAKWLSLDNHIHNVHSGHSQLFPQCAHGDLHGSDRNKKWFKRRKYDSYLALQPGITIKSSFSCQIFSCVDTKASEKILPLITSTTLCKDIARLSPLYQTSHLESFHSVVIHYAPKSIALSYKGMQCRYVNVLVI